MVSWWSSEKAMAERRWNCSSLEDVFVPVWRPVGVWKMAVDFDLALEVRRRDSQPSRRLNQSLPLPQDGQPVEAGAVSCSVPEDL